MTLAACVYWQVCERSIHSTSLSFFIRLHILTLVILNSHGLFLQCLLCECCLFFFYQCLLLISLPCFATDERYSENDLVCLTNQGDIEIFTLPQLRRQLKESCIRKENVR